MRLERERLAQLPKGVRLGVLGLREVFPPTGDPGPLPEKTVLEKLRDRGFEIEHTTYYKALAYVRRGRMPE
jgi:hypothetical protein